MNAKDKAELEKLRKMAQENSERNHGKDVDESVAVTAGVVWTLVFIVILVVSIKASWTVPTWLFIGLPTLIAFGTARLIRQGARNLREIKREELGWDSDESTR